MNQDCLHFHGFYLLIHYIYTTNLKDCATKITAQVSMKMYDITLQDNLDAFYLLSTHRTKYFDEYVVQKYAKYIYVSRMKKLTILAQILT